jgi:hypothetical protein
MTDVAVNAPRRGSALLPSAVTRHLSAHDTAEALPIAGVAIALAGALAMWGFSLHLIHTRGLGRYGLPPALPAIWYAALVVLICGAVTVIWAMRPNVMLISLYVFAIGIVLYATVPALTAVPHYAWVYKHIGVTRFIATHGGVDPSIDIYNRWPGFFAAAAAVSRLAGVDPLSYAAWAEPFFALLEALLVGTVALAIGRDVRVAGYAALTFTLGNWIGQAYFAPQAAAYALALALVLVFVRSFSTGAITPRLSRLMETVVRKEAPRIALANPLRWSRTTSIAVVLGLDIAIIATHQLTPYVLILQLGALMVIGLSRPAWLIVVMGILTVAYLIPNLSYIEQNFGLFTSLNPASNVQHGESTPAHIDSFDANAGGLLSIVLIALMLASAIRLARTGRGSQALPLVVMAVAPFGILFAQNYGGEASLRVFLFSSPWRDILIALGLLTITRPRLRAAAALATCLVLAYMFIPAFYGAEDLNIMPPGEVRASEYFYAHAPAGSVLLLAAPDYPTRAGPRYGLMRGDWPNIAASAAFEHQTLSAAQIPGVIRLIHEFAHSGFVVFSTTGYQYAAVHDLTPPGQLQNMEHAIATSPRFALWYATGDARIYRLNG